ncbi:MAG: lactate utilization protein [Peptococcaceae bacterium]|nr:lactate utilization protein [Peptococcaceae bacterium]
MYGLFRERAEAVSARVIRAGGPGEAAGALAGIIEEEKVKKIVAEPSGMVERCVRILEERGVLAEGGQEGGGRPALFFRDLRRQAGDAGLGISEMALAVAETGSLAGDCTSMESRLVSTLPPVHVALVPSSGLVATPGEAIERFYGGGRTPGYLSFISGPSRTADIERVLTIGVHGPERLYIILVDEEGGGGND